jgi:hypothetical protein
VLLSLAGRQPATGPATLSGVRALERHRGWLAPARLARATAEVQPRLAPARRWAEALGQPVRLWRAEKPDACVRGSAAECPGGPHRSGAHHCLREVAQPVREAASHAKGQRRRTVRGVRAIAPEGCAAPRTPQPPVRLAPPREATPADAVQAADASQDGVRADGAAGRGLLTDAPGGPLPPPGGRLAAAWAAGPAARQRTVEAHQGGRPRSAGPGEQATAHGGGRPGTPSKRLCACLGTLGGRSRRPSHPTVAQGPSVRRSCRPCRRSATRATSRSGPPWAR